MSRSGDSKLALCVSDSVCVCVWSVWTAEHMCNHSVKEVTQTGLFTVIRDAKLLWRCLKTMVRLYSASSPLNHTCCRDFRFLSPGGGLFEFTGPAALENKKKGKKTSQQLQGNADLHLWLADQKQTNVFHGTAASKSVWPWEEKKKQKYYFFKDSTSFTHLC